MVPYLYAQVYFLGNNHPDRREILRYSEELNTGD